MTQGIWKLRYKILAGSIVMFASILLLNNMIIQCIVKKSISQTLEKQLHLLTDDAVSMIRIGIDSTIRNYLRGIAEKNKDLVNFYYQQVQQGNLSEEQAKEQIAPLLLAQKIGATGYLFVLDIANVPAEIIVRIHPKIPGANVAEYDFAQQIAEKKEGYLEYPWKDADEDTARNKVASVVYFDPWQWLICASSYTEEFHYLVHPADFSDSLLNVVIGETGYLSLMDMKGLLLIHPKLQGENIYESRDANGNYFIQEVIRQKTGTVLYDWQNPGDAHPRSKFAYTQYLPEMDWIIWATSYTEEIYRPLETLNRLFFSVAIGTLGLVVLLSMWLSRSLTTPIVQLSAFTENVAKGDLSQQIQMTRRDEIGWLAIKLNQMVQQLRLMSGQVQHAAASVSTTVNTILQQMNLLTTRMNQQASSVEQTTTAAESINQFIAALGEHTQKLLNKAEQVLSSIHEIGTSRKEVTTSIEHLTSQLHLISSSIEQVNGALTNISGHAARLNEVAQKTEQEIQQIDHSLREVADNANRSQLFARETMETAQHGQISVEASIQGMVELKTVVTDTARIIQEVNSWGEQVSSILTIVDDITEQTSLLALNAAIISAQAGEQGRGFAVVADEIKNLATRTKASTREINSLIQTLQKNTAEGVAHITEGIAKADQGMELVQAVEDSLRAILERATRSASMASDTAHVTQQTTSSSQAIRNSMNTVSEMAAQMSQAIHTQEQEITHVMRAVENIQQMAEHVTLSSTEQNDTARLIASNMEYITEKIGVISSETTELKVNSQHIVTAMRTIDAIAEDIARDSTAMTQETLNSMVRQAETLQEIVNAFKTS